MPEVVEVRDDSEVERLVAKKFLEMKVEIFVVRIEQQFGCFRGRHIFSIPKWKK